MPVTGIRFASRTSKGVTIFKTAAGEKVVGVERISEPQSGEEGEVADDVQGTTPSAPLEDQE